MARQAAERNVAHLRSLLNAVDEPALHYVTGNVIADARGPFLRSALINLGRDDGVRVGYAVINGDGLIGRTVDAGSSVARVLLLSDLNSRIPVLVGPGGRPGARLGRQQRGLLKLEFIPDGASLYAGDEVYTSGSDGVLPRGLRVGVVTGSAGAFKVRPHAELSALDVVSVLFFDTPALARTDPPAVPADRALSAIARGQQAPGTIPRRARPSTERDRRDQAGRNRRRRVAERRRSPSPAMNAALPALSVLFAVFATAVPWGLPADATFILPLVVVMMVFCWRVLPGSDLPPYVAMLLGLLTDVMSGGPLGFWALMALTGANAGGGRRRSATART